MNTQELILAVHSEVNPARELMKIEVAEVVEKALEIIQREVLKGTQVHLSGIGRLVQHERPARAGRNPKTGEEIQIPAKTVIKLKPTAALKSI